MRGSLDLDDILKMNPQVDESELKKSLDFSEGLREAGLEAVGYRLASPLDSRRLRIAETKGQRRAVYLRLG